MWSDDFESCIVCRWNDLQAKQPSSPVVKKKTLLLYKYQFSLHIKVRLPTSYFPSW